MPFLPHPVLKSGYRIGASHTIAVSYGPLAKKSTDCHTLPGLAEEAKCR